MSFNQIALLKQKGFTLFVDSLSKVGGVTWIELVFSVSVLNLLVHFPGCIRKILCYIASIPTSSVRNEHHNMVLPHCPIAMTTLICPNAMFLYMIGFFVFEEYILRFRCLYL